VVVATHDKSGDLMGYGALEEEALRGVVRAALRRIAMDGLPGAHQFFVTFKSQAPGVSGPPEVLARFPDDMMVVFKPEQFRDLEPGEDSFSVTLSFGGQPRSLTVPYAAIVGFEDPAVGYRLRFSPPAPSPEPAPEPPPKLKREPASPAHDANAPNIVSLDQFRKK
jgi:hypothetical protein